MLGKGELRGTELPVDPEDWAYRKGAEGRIKGEPVGDDGDGGSSMWTVSKEYVANSKYLPREKGRRRRGGGDCVVIEGWASCMYV